MTSIGIDKAIQERTCQIPVPNKAANSPKTINVPSATGKPQSRRNGLFVMSII